MNPAMAVPLTMLAEAGLAASLAPLIPIMGGVTALGIVSWKVVAWWKASTAAAAEAVALAAAEAAKFAAAEALTVAGTAAEAVGNSSGSSSGSGCRGSGNSINIDSNTCRRGICHSCYRWNLLSIF